MSGRIYIKFKYLLLILAAWSGISYSQIVLFERKQGEDVRNNETIFDSPSRKKIDLNGQWKASFDNSNPAPVHVPFAADYKGSILLQKDFTVPDSLLRGYTFLFVAEGINYYSEVKVNNIIVSRNSGGLKLISTEIQENIVSHDNTVSVLVANNPDNELTLPLAFQSNYAKNYTGIQGNIYLLAVPKLYINDFLADYKFESDNQVRITNTVHINTNVIDSQSVSGKSFFVKTELIRKSNSEKIAESPNVRFEAGNYQTYTITNELAVRNFEYWSPDKPELYYIRVVASSQDRSIDELSFETGFASVKTSGRDLIVNGKKTRLNGVNYFTDLPRFADAVEYLSAERDLQKIKECGFNCVRITGRPAHPFIVKICQRIGLFLLEDIPFNEVPASVLKSERYIKDAVDFMENIIKRDKHSPSVLFWGIGNDFDVTSAFAEKYAARIKETASLLDRRELYYTTRKTGNDPLEKIISIKGLNVIEDDIESVKNIASSTDRNKFIFISAFGVSVNNRNRNGSGDRQSVEFQAKLLTESYKMFGQYPGAFMNSFADYNAECPLIGHFEDNNYYLRTDGLFEYSREPKYTAGIIKKLLYNQGFQKIPEGTEVAEKKESFFFLTSGLAVLFLFILTLGRIPYLKENILKSFITPKNFLHLVKEQSPVTNFQNSVVLFFISFSVSLFISTVLFYLRLDDNFDLLLSKLAGSGVAKIFLIDVLNKPLFLLGFFTAVFIIFVFMIYIAVAFFTSFSKRHVKFRTVYTVISWSFMSMIIFFVFGILYSKAINYGMILNLSFYLFGILLIYCLYKIINGIRYTYEFGAFKSFFYGTLSILLFGGVLYLYAVILRSLPDYWELIKTFN